jgi:hypothetical protein
MKCEQLCRSSVASKPLLPLMGGRALSHCCLCGVGIEGWMAACQLLAYPVYRPGKRIPCPQLHGSSPECYQERRMASGSVFILEVNRIQLSSLPPSLANGLILSRNQIHQVSKSLWKQRILFCCKISFTEI